MLTQNDGSAISIQSIMGRDSGLRMLIPGNSIFLEKVFIALTGQKRDEYESGRVFGNGLYPQALIVMTPVADPVTVLNTKGSETEHM